MFIVGELLTYVWSREGMHDALWLAYIATFIKQWGLTSATGFMWALVPEVIAYGELKSGKRNAAIINAIMGLFFKIGFTIGGAIPLWLLAVYGFNESSRAERQRHRRDHYDRSVDPDCAGRYFDGDHAGLSDLR